MSRPATGYLMESPPAARTLISGHWRDYFAGCSYLGLPGHPGLIEAATEALRQYGLTTATSRGGYGEHPVFHRLEAAAARFFDAERVTYYVSAYLGNGVLLQGLAGEYERVFCDESAHFSVRDAARAAGVPLHTFRHRDAAHLAEQLRACLRLGERPLVLTDGIFPVSGEIAPLRDYAAALSPYEGAILCVDDAHATGVIGRKGWGTAEHWGLESAEGVRIFAAHTLSKALGGHGGVIAGSAAFIEQLSRNAGALAGSSPPPIPAAAAAAWALDHVAAHPELRKRLWQNVARARAGFRRLGWALEDTPVPIICLAARPGFDLGRLRDELFDRDICVAHVTRYSSTPAGGALRIAIFATHTDEQIDRLLAECGDLL
jgi:glycine C-acetyltransferase/8-amino-7-oxononanoate synthase